MFSVFPRREASAPADWEGAIDLEPAINRVLLDEHDFEKRTLVLASPVCGNGIMLTNLEVMLLAGLREADPVRWIAAELKRRGINMRSSADGELVDSDAAREGAIIESLEGFRAVKIPVLARLGIVRAAG